MYYYSCTVFLDYGRDSDEIYHYLVFQTYKDFYKKRSEIKDLKKLHERISID